jgi:hypothetical protein
LPVTAADGIEVRRYFLDSGKDVLLFTTPYPVGRALPSPDGRTIYVIEPRDRSVRRFISNFEVRPRLSLFGR